MSYEYLIGPAIIFIGAIIALIFLKKEIRKNQELEYENLQLMINYNKAKAGIKEGVNPENKCAHLFKMENPKKDALSFIWGMQKKFQESLGIYKKDMPIKYRMQKVTEHWGNLCVEFGELMDRLPFKTWKKYNKIQLGILDIPEERLEIYFEYIDMLHFFINIGLYLGITDYKLVYSLYKSKNQENINRQKRGY